MNDQQRAQLRIIIEGRKPDPRQMGLDTYRDRVISADPSTSPAQLSALHNRWEKHPDFPEAEAGRQALAQNPNISLKDLDMLIQRYPEKAKDNPALPLLALEDPSWWLKFAPSNISTPAGAGFLRSYYRVGLLQFETPAISYRHSLTWFQNTGEWLEGSLTIWKTNTPYVYAVLKEVPSNNYNTRIHKHWFADLDTAVKWGNNNYPVRNTIGPHPDSLEPTPKL